MDENEEPIPYTREFVVDVGYQRTLVNAIFRSAYRPWFWILFGVLALVFASTAIFGDSTFRVIFVVWVVLMGLLILVRYFRVRATLRRAFPVGTVMRSGFGATQFVITNGADTSRLAYSGFDRAERGGDLVWHRLSRRTVPRGGPRAHRRRLGQLS